MKFASLVKEKKGVVILITDQWRSPISALSDFFLQAYIEAPSAWDSAVAPTVLTEMLIAQVQESNWPRTQRRMKELEDYFNAIAPFNSASRHRRRD